MTNTPSPRILLASILIPLALIIAAVPANKTRPYKLNADQLLREVVEKSQFVSPDLVADMIILKDPLLQLIDVRNADQFERYHLPGAINVPLPDLLSDEWQELLNQDTRTNVFYSNGTVEANQAWLITRQLGYENNYVLQGGLNYWAETILNPEQPEQTSPDEEIARYNFRKAAGQALGNDASQPAGDSVRVRAPSSIVPPALQKIPKKKKVQGGC